MVKKNEDKILIYSFKLNRNININEIIESLMFFSLDDTMNIYGKKETLYVYNSSLYQNNYKFNSLNSNNDYSIKYINPDEDDNIFL